MSDPWTTPTGGVAADPWRSGAPPAAPPAGWYADPSGVGQQRYWDGRAWTLGVVIDGRVTEHPMPWPPAPIQPGGGSAPGERDVRIVLPARAGLYALAGFVVGVVLGVGLALAARAAGAADIVVLLLNLAGLWTGLLGACKLASRRWGTGHVRQDFGLRIGRADVGWGLLVSLAARLAGVVVAIPLVFLSRRLVGDNQGVYGKVTADWTSFVIFGVIAVVGAPLVEELFFRGLLLRSLTGPLGVDRAIALQAVLFGLAHFSPLLGLANVAVIAIIAAAGVIFGITATKRSIGTSAVAHGAFNLLSVVAAAFLAF